MVENEQPGGGDFISDHINKSTDDRQYEAHPLIGSLIGPRNFEFKEIEVDKVDEIYSLERRYEAMNYVNNWFSQPDLSPTQHALAPLYAPMHAVDEINNQFATKLAPAFLHEDPEQALDSFRAVVPNTIDEEMLLLTNDQEFIGLHHKLHEYLNQNDSEIQARAKAREQEIKKYDKMQFSGNARRSLEIMLEGGMIMGIDPEGVEKIKNAHQLAGDGILPLTEYIKNEKVLIISGFSGSKISLAVHDFMDHFWTFDLIRREGIIDRYNSMFTSIGNPEHTDIYKREGEMVASVAFGVRLFQTMPSAFAPIMRSSQIETHMDDMLVKGELEERHMEAYRTLKGLRKGSIEWQSLGFSFSNYITELDEQRRKYGKIKQRDPRTRHIVGELNPLSADFLSFFIDTHHQILLSKNKHLNDLFRFQILMEEYLVSFAKGEVPENETLCVKLDQLRDLDFSQTTLPVQRLTWLRKNYGFTATRSAMV